MVRGVGSSVEDPALNWGGAWLWVPVLGFLCLMLYPNQAVLALLCLS